MPFRQLIRWVLCGMCLFIAGFISAPHAFGQQVYTWEQIKARFEADNPTLKADQANVEEMRAQEITADLRPNPQFGLTVDGTQIAPDHGVWQPLAGTFIVPSISYLHERDHKRELRLKSAQEGTQIAETQHEDLDRNMLFGLRTAFVDTLEAKAVVELAKADLEYYDKIIDIARNRFRAGDMAQVDLDRIELQRVQYESEIQSAIVNLRTAKIQLLQLLDDTKTPIEKFDVSGPFDFSETIEPLPDVQQTALTARPDLRAALETIQQSETNHKLAIANGSTDPTFGGWYTYNSSTNNPETDYSQTLGLSVGIPLRIFDRNQGEKKRTEIDIARTQQASEAARAQVFSDVNNAYQQVESDITLLKPYKARYNDQAVRVRDTITYAWQRGGASLMDFLNAQSDYRQVRLAYLQLIGAYLTAAAQLEHGGGARGDPVRRVWGAQCGAAMLALFFLAGCGKKFDPADGAPPQPQVIDQSNAARVTIDHPEQFPVVAAERIEVQDELNVTGTVNPDISREVPVISLASGRIVDIRARLDDHVKKGDVLLKVESPDITNAFNAYLKAVNDEHLTALALARAKDLLAHGAVPQAQVEQAQDAEDDAKADLIAAEQQLKTLGVNKDHPSDIVEVRAPISGVIVAQNVTNAAAAGVTYAGSATTFTIADLSEVWILCNVYENQLASVHTGQTAQIALNAYPDKRLTGRISDIGPVLDPNLRTASVRIQVSNPDNLLRLGMFVTATLVSKTKQVHAVVPATAILHLHDRDWVFVPGPDHQFQRIEVTGGPMRSGNRQEILNGILPGQQVVSNVLALEEALEAQ